MTHQACYDVLIIGSGASGLSLALSLADKLNVAVVSKAGLSESATLYAQGGVSAVMDQSDSIESHIHDTLNAGAGLCDVEVVSHIVKRGRERVEWLIEQGVPFSTHKTDKGNIEFHLTREGGHSNRRVVHAADATGRAIETTLVAQTNGRDDISVYENHMAIDLITHAKLGMNTRSLRRRLST